MDNYGKYYGAASLVAQQKGGQHKQSAHPDKGELATPVSHPGSPLRYTGQLAAAVAAAVVVIVAATAAAAVRTAAAEAVAAAEKDQDNDDDPGAASAKTVTHCLAPPFVYST